jgi:hypothetical protein
MDGAGVRTEHCASRLRSCEQSQRDRHPCSTLEAVFVLGDRDDEIDRVRHPAQRRPPEWTQWPVGMYGSGTLVAPADKAVALNRLLLRARRSYGLVIASTVALLLSDTTSTVQ